MSQRIYLDNNACAQLDPRLIEFICKTLPTLQGNPSSTHFYGQIVRKQVEKARSTIASYLKVQPSELIFTSGGTESVNMAIRGLICCGERGHILTSAVEHAAVFASCKRLEKEGYSVTFLRPGPWGAVSPEMVEAFIQPNTQLVALMSVNNETGVKTDIDAIAKITEKRRIPLFVDAVAQMGKEPIQIPLGVSSMAFSGHKMHGLQGTGLLFLRSRHQFFSLLVGGAQELGRRAGSENILGILCFAKAVEWLLEDSNKTFPFVHRLKEHFESVLLGMIPGLLINGEGPRVSNVSNLYFPRVDGESLLIHLDRMGIAASHGSACSSGALEPSRILLGMDLPLDRVRSSLRFSFGRLNTIDEIEMTCGIIKGVVTHLAQN